LPHKRHSFFVAMPFMFCYFIGKVYKYIFKIKKA
jgi:hypothetical protein